MTDLHPIDTTPTSSSPSSSSPASSAGMEWHAVDADDRWPGRWTAHTASVHAHGRTYLIRVTPAITPPTTAPGFHADIDGGYGQHWTLRAPTLSDAQRRAVAEVWR